MEAQAWSTWPADCGALVGVYLRETRRRNKDRSSVSYLQLAHNERHPVTGSPVAKVIHNFGRADKIDREALRRLVSSISRFLEPGDAVGRSEAGGGVDVVDSRRMGGAYVPDALWNRLGIAKALKDAAAGRRIDAGAFERVFFALGVHRNIHGSRFVAGCGCATVDRHDPVARRGAGVRVGPVGSWTVFRPPSPVGVDRSQFDGPES